MVIHVRITLILSFHQESLMWHGWVLDHNAWVWQGPIWQMSTRSTYVTGNWSMLSISQWAVYVGLCAEKYYVIVMITCQVLHTVSYFLSLKGFLEILFYYSNYCHHTKYYTLWDIFCILSCNGYLQIPPLWDRTVFSVMLGTLSNFFTVKQNCTLNRVRDFFTFLLQETKLYF